MDRRERAGRDGAAIRRLRRWRENAVAPQLAAVMGGLTTHVIPRAWMVPVLICFLIRAGPVLGQRIAPSPMTSDDVERFADSAVARYVTESPGPSLAAVVVRGDSVLLAKGYGYAYDSIPVSPESTVFHIASLSKLFVVVAVLQQVENGQVALDTPAATYLPECEIPPAVTVRQLLTHTSGIDSPFLADVVDDASELPSLAEYFSEHRPRFGRPPRNEIRYSNYGMALAARIVEVVSGEPFDTYVEHHIFAPLGMRRTAIRQPPPPGISERVAISGSGPVPDFLQVYPAGAIVSTPADMGRFMLALLDDGKNNPILSLSSVREMKRRQWTVNRAIPGIALGLIESDMGGVRALFHPGARPHFSLIYLLPEKRAGLFIVQSMRQGGPFQNLRTSFARAFVKRYFATSSLDRGADRPALTAPAVAGTYRPVLFSRTTMEKAAWLFADTRVVANEDGSLDVRLPASAPLRAVPQDGAFRVIDGEQEGLAVGFDRTVTGWRMSLAGATQDPISFERLRWYERGLLHLVLLAIAVTVMAGLSLATLVATGWRALRTRSRQAISAGERRLIRPLLISSALLAAAPAVAIATLMLSSGSAGPRRAIATGATLVYVAAVVGLASVPIALLAWRRSFWRRGRHVYLTAFAGCSVVLFALATYYHLGPFWLR